MSPNKTMPEAVERPEALDCAKQWPSNWCAHTCGRAYAHEGGCWCTYCGNPQTKVRHCENETCGQPVAHAESYNGRWRGWCAAHTPWSGHWERCGALCKGRVLEGESDETPADYISRDGAFKPLTPAQAYMILNCRTTPIWLRLSEQQRAEIERLAAQAGSYARMRQALGAERVSAGPEDFGGSDYDTGFETGWERQGREMAEKEKTKATEAKRTYEARLAKVESAELFIEDHGVLTCYVMLDGGGWGQGFGGLCLSRSDPDPQDKTHRQRGSAQGLDFVLRVLELFRVDKLSQCVGRTVYALYAEPYQLNDSIAGLRLPAFDGGREFLLEDWRKEWEQRTELIR
jgi:hypothetical protein